LEKLLPQMRRDNRSSTSWLIAVLLCLPCCLAVGAVSQESVGDGSLSSSAVCPVVYQLDRAASSRGYHYSFFGNGFFINELGYLLTVAHVLETFRDGAQPYILVSRPNSPPQLVQASIVATDPEHDVAILLATPNPFAGIHKVAFLPLSSEPAFQGQVVMALSLHPPKVQNAHTFEVPREDRSSGEVLSYETTQLEKAAPSAEVFLLGHPVTLGQSGSPVLALNSRAVVGLVEGRWLRSSAVSAAKSSSSSMSPPGVAVPIRYAIALLQSHSIAWHTPAPQPMPSSAPSR
jgi:S1-C subfamily serine protease